MRRTQEERSVTTRRKLIQAAIVLICERGCAEATTVEIARRAGVSRGALQHQFGSRYELLAAVCDWLPDESLALRNDLQTEHKPIDLRVDAVIRHYWSLYTSPSFMAILNTSLGTRGDRRLHNRLRRHLGELYRKNGESALELFADSVLSEDELIVLWRMTLATLRGLALAHIMGLANETPQVDIDLLKTLVVERLRRNDPVITSDKDRRRKKTKPL
jgi:AcrR family transcriptional regulator